MEQVPASAHITLELEKSLRPKTEREAVEPLETYALTMIGNLADQKPHLTYEWPGNGHIWNMALHFVHEFPEPILDVTLPFGGNLKAYFRPLTEENWPAFMRHIKIATQEQRDSLQQRIPELSKRRVNFKPDVVPCPPSIKKRTEPLLFNCTQWGGFDRNFQTLGEFFDRYYPEPEVAPISSEGQPAEPSNNQ